MDDIVELERQGWEALTMEGEAGRRFFATILDEDAVMLFAGGLRLEGRERILASLAAQPWQTFHIEDARAVELSPGTVTLIYKVTAQRADSEPYVALIGSTYSLRDGAWRLVVHQHTPV